MHHCTLCGAATEDTLLLPTAVIQRETQKRVAPGPVVYESVMRATGDGIPACRMCARYATRLGRHRLKVMFPMDAAILQTLVPGTRMRQDPKQQARMLGELRKCGNLYSTSFRPLRMAVAEPRAAAWWECNLRTEFFAHKQTARAMRVCGW